MVKCALAMTYLLEVSLIAKEVVDEVINKRLLKLVTFSRLPFRQYSVDFCKLFKVENAGFLLLFYLHNYIAKGNKKVERKGCCWCH